MFRNIFGKGKSANSNAEGLPSFASPEFMPMPGQSQSANDAMKGKAQQTLEQTMDQANFMAEGLSEKPSEALRYGIELASKRIDELAMQIGVQSLTESEKETVFLTPEIYRRLMQDFFGEVNIDSVAGTATGLKKVWLNMDNTYQDATHASHIFHEYIHRTFDKKILVYSKDKSTGRIKNQSGRYGLSVHKILEATAEGKTERTGNILNELGNAYWEVDFFNRLIQDKKASIHFAQEVAKREYLNKKFFPIEGHPFIQIPYEDKSFLLAQNNFFPNSEENGIQGKSLAKELIDDLQALYGNIDGLPLSVALLKAKTEPAFQNRIRAVIDGTPAAPDGFFQRIKDAKEEREIAGILIDVQAKIKEVKQEIF